MRYLAECTVTLRYTYEIDADSIEEAEQIPNITLPEGFELVNTSKPIAFKDD